MPIVSWKEQDGKFVYKGSNITLTLQEGHSHTTRNRQIFDADGFRFIPHVCLRLAEEFELAGVAERFNPARFCLTLDSIVPPNPDFPPLQARNIVVNAIRFAVDSSAEARIHSRESSGLPAGNDYIHNAIWQTHQFCLSLSSKLEDCNGANSYFNCGLLISRY